MQGDTTTALAGALAAFHRRVPVAHVEAGLRSGDPGSPFPEEVNRRLITRLATWHFAATDRNRDTLVAEGVPARRVRDREPDRGRAPDVPGPRARGARGSPLLEATAVQRLVLTTHRRESFGARLSANLRALRGFVDRPDVVLLFPVHPNPAVRETRRRFAATSASGSWPRSPTDFIGLLSSAWLDRVRLGRRAGGGAHPGPAAAGAADNTERPEAVERALHGW